MLHFSSLKKLLLPLFCFTLLTSCSTISDLHYRAMGINFKVKDEDLVPGKMYIDESADGNTLVARMLVCGATMHSDTLNTQSNIAKRGETRAGHYRYTWVYKVEGKKNRILGPKEYTFLVERVSKAEIGEYNYSSIDGDFKTFVNMRLLNNDEKYKDMLKERIHAHEEMHKSDFDLSDTTCEDLTFDITDKMSNDLVKEIYDAYNKTTEHTKLDKKPVDIDVDKLLTAIATQRKISCKITAVLEARAMQAAIDYSTNHYKLEKDKSIKIEKQTKLETPIKHKFTGQYMKWSDLGISEDGEVTYWGAYEKFKAFANGNNKFSGLKEQHYNAVKKIGYFYLKALYYCKEDKTEQLEIESSSTTQNLLDIAAIGIGITSAITQYRKQNIKKPAPAQPSGSKYCWCGKRIGHMSNHAKKQ